jgi:hypothetical protein
MMPPRHHVLPSSSKRSHQLDKPGYAIAFLIGSQPHTRRSQPA